MIIPEVSKNPNSATLNALYIFEHVHSLYAIQWCTLGLIIHYAWGLAKYHFWTPSDYSQRVQGNKIKCLDRVVGYQLWGINIPLPTFIDEVGINI